MRKALLLGGMIVLAGCLMRTYTVEKPRTDTDVVGNQGFLVGESQAQGERQGTPRLTDTRKISVFEIEFGGSGAPRSSKAYGKEKSEEFVEFERSQDVDVSFSEEAIRVEPRYEEYTVQKGDTLQEISHKFYGTTKKWKMLYDANADVLKSPDRIYPGKTIRIPFFD